MPCIVEQGGSPGTWMFNQCWSNAASIVMVVTLRSTKMGDWQGIGGESSVPGWIPSFHELRGMAGNRRDVAPFRQSGAGGHV